MTAIRTLLWIGPSTDLVRFRLTEWSTLDVVWVEGLGDVGGLPPISADAIVIGELSEREQLRAIAEMSASTFDAPVFAAVANIERQRLDQLRAAGVSGVLRAGHDTASPVPAQIEALLRACRCGAEGRPRPEPTHSHASGPVLIGRSRALVEIETAIRSAARSHASVLIQGETGTGKEIVARRIHAQSARRAAPFVAINCAAFADTLLESELFGHRRGAFTGADRDRVGLFERAAGGTVFLDEIAETSPALQARLLRVIQEREVLPVGGDRPRRIDVRIVSATHRALRDEIAARRFREDLFYRLAVLTIGLPPLRERIDDVRPLAEHFLVLHGERESKPDCRLSPHCLKRLERHSWPGNVRELENEIQRLLALAEPGELITGKRLSHEVRVEPAAAQTQVCQSETLQQALDRIECQLIRTTLAEHGGAKTRTARRLGVTREGLYKKMKRLNVE